MGAQTVSEKVEGQTLRLFPQDLLPAVKSAVEFLKNLTVEGRRIAAQKERIIGCRLV